MKREVSQAQRADHARSRFGAAASVPASAAASIVPDCSRDMAQRLVSVRFIGPKLVKFAGARRKDLHEKFGVQRRSGRHTGVRSSPRQDARAIGGAAEGGVSERGHADRGAMGALQARPRRRW